jgi:hypothetical protein
MLARMGKPIGGVAEQIAATVRGSGVIASDETSARVKGKTHWQWTFGCATAVYHVIAPTTRASYSRIILASSSGGRALAKQLLLRLGAVRGTQPHLGDRRVARTPSLAVAEDVVEPSSYLP